MLTVERKVVALAVASVLIPNAVFLGVWLRWPDGAPSSDINLVAVGTLGVGCAGFAGFRLQQRLWPSGDRLFFRTFMWMMLVLTIVGAVTAARIFGGVGDDWIGGDWVGVVWQSAVILNLIWLMVVRLARDSDAK